MINRFSLPLSHVLAAQSTHPAALMLGEGLAGGVPLVSRPPAQHLPASLCEHNDGTGTALEGGLDGTHGDGLGGVAGQAGGAAQLLK